MAKSGRRALIVVHSAWRRGEVWWVSLDPAVGTEIRETRLAVVVSNESCDTHGSRVVVLPITSNVESLFPGEAQMRVRGGAARALGDQIRSVDKRRLTGRIGKLSADEMESVDDALRITLDL